MKLGEHVPFWCYFHYIPVIAEKSLFSYTEGRKYANFISLELLYIVKTS